MAFGNQSYRNKNCVVCSAVFAPKHQCQVTCSDQCRLKHHVIDYSNPDACWIFDSKSTQNKKFNYGALWIGGKAKTMPAHRFSYQAFNGPLIEGQFICHKCDVPLCVNPTHLFQGSPEDNLHDMVRKGRADIKQGSRVGTAKLNETQVLEIFQSAESYEALGERYGVAPRTIKDIFLGSSWSHLTGLPNRNRKHRKTPEILARPPLY